MCPGVSRCFVQTRGTGDWTGDAVVPSLSKFNAFRTPEPTCEYHRCSDAFVSQCRDQSKPTSAAGRRRIHFPFAVAPPNVRFHTSLRPGKVDRIPSARIDTLRRVQLAIDCPGPSFCYRLSRRAASSLDRARIRRGSPTKRAIPTFSFCSPRASRSNKPASIMIQIEEASTRSI